MERSRAGSGEATDRGWRACCGRRALSLFALACASCADLLDIPEHPRLPPAPAESPLTERPATGTLEVGSPPQAAAMLEPSARAGAPEARAQPGLAEPIARGAETPAPFEPLDAGTPPVDAAPAADAAAAPPPCAASQSLGPNGDCFATVGSLLSWSAARQACRNLGDGWDLASIRDATVNSFVASLLAGETWIGAADQTREGTWRWVSDGSVFWRGLAGAAAP